jgi:hypothetical protein
MLPIQRSTPAEGSAGGVGGVYTTTSSRLATATTSKGRCSGRSATTVSAASMRRSSLKAGIVAPAVMGGSNARCSCSTGSKPGIAPTHAGLNKSEQRHFLAQVICTFKQGRIANKAIADRSAEAQQFRASGLNVVIATIAFWNSTYIADAIAHLRATEQSVPDAWLASASPAIS